MIALRAYVTVWDFFNHLFGVNIPFAEWNLPPNMFGFWMAMSFMTGGFLLYSELKRRAQLGLFAGHVTTIQKGGINISECIFNGFIGFVIGYKLPLVYQLFKTGKMHDFQYELLSNKGILSTGFLGLITAIIIYYLSIPKPIKKKTTITITEYPHQLIGSMIFIAAFSGIMGSNIFDLIETSKTSQAFVYNLKEFLTNPSSWVSGLTILGGLIFGIGSLSFYAYKKNIHQGHMFDSLAPAFLMAYGVGRIACHTSGDGDWGIINTFKKPSWVPDFLWSNTYAHGVSTYPKNAEEVNEYVHITDCTGQYCYELAQGVYPTSLYEFLICGVFFLILWNIRKKLTYIPGLLVSIFLIFNGIERYGIEQIRDLSQRNLYMGLKQAEWISIFMIFIGFAMGTYLYIRHYRKYSSR